MVINDDILKQFNVTIGELSPKIIDSIVSIYGEKHRSLIQDRLNRIYINTYITYEDINNYYNSSLKHTEALLSISFLKDLRVNVSAEIEEEVYKNGTYYLHQEQKDILQTYFGYNTFDSNSPIYSFDEDPAQDLENYQTKRKLQNRCDILNKLGYSVTPEDYHSFAETDDGKQAISDIKQVYDIAIKYREEITKFKNEHQDIKDYINQCDKLKDELALKYTRKFFEDLLPILPDEDKPQITKALSSQVHSKYELLRIADPNKKYYSESYEKVNPDLGSELSSKVATIKTNCQLQKEREFFRSTGNYQTCLDNLSSLGLLSEDSFNMDFIKNKVTCVSPNVVKDANGDFTNFNVIHLPILGMLKEYRDVLVIHEILHVVELTMKQVSDKDFDIKTGLDSITMALSDTPFSAEPIEDEYIHNIRQNEYLSENLHHQLAIQVTEDLHSKGIYLFDDPKTSKIYGSSSYEQLNQVILPFMNTFYTDIVDAMIEPDESSLTDKIGQDNLDHLNSIVKEYREIPYYKMMNDVINHVDSELTRKRTSLISDAQNLSQTMLEHSRNQEKTYTISPEEIGKLTINKSTISKHTAKQIVQNDINIVLEKTNQITK